MKVGKEECEVTLIRVLVTHEGIIFITFLKCGMLREYYLSSKQYLVMLKCYLGFTGSLSIV